MEQTCSAITILFRELEIAELQARIRELEAKLERSKADLGLWEKTEKYLQEWYGLFFCTRCKGLWNRRAHETGAYCDDCRPWHLAPEQELKP